MTDFILSYYIFSIFKTKSKSNNPKKMKKIPYLLVLLLTISSCNYFSKDKEEEELKKRQQEYKLEQEIAETKTFNYLIEQIYWDKKINKDTIQIVLNEYYKEYKYFAFNSGTNYLEKMDRKYNTPTHLLDFVNATGGKTRIERNKIFIVTKEIELFFNFKKLDQLEDISSELWDLNSNNE